MFYFYFISFHYYSSHFTPINSFSINLDNHPPLLSTTIRRRPSPLSADAVPDHQPLIATDGHQLLLIATVSYHWLPPTATPSITVCRCCPPHPPLFAVVSHHRFPSPTLFVDNKQWPPLPVVVGCYCTSTQLSPPIAHHRRLPQSTRLVF